MKDPAALGIDGVLITHGHFDHIGQGGAEAIDAITRRAAPPRSPSSRSPPTSAARAAR